MASFIEQDSSKHSLSMFEFDLKENSSNRSVLALLEREFVQLGGEFDKN